MNEYSEVSDDSRVYGREWDKLQYKRYLKFENCLDQLKFDNFMLRLVYEHDKEDRYIHKKPSLNNKLNFIFEYLINNNVDTKYYKIKETEPNRIWLYRGYFFQVIYSDQTTYKVYNKDDLTLMISI